MADVLIKGIEMPKEGRLVLAICPNGSLYRYFGKDGVEKAQEALLHCEVIELPEHGRLIDADELTYETIVTVDDFESTHHKVIPLENIQNAPTILEASK